MKTTNMKETTVTFSDFRSICRYCLGDCVNAISFNIDISFIFKNIIADILPKGASIQVSNYGLLL